MFVHCARNIRHVTNRWTLQYNLSLTRILATAAAVGTVRGVGVSTTTPPLPAGCHVTSLSRALLLVSLYLSTDS